MRLLLDEHIPPSLTAQLNRCGYDAATLQQWRGGALLGRPDEEILTAALEEERVLLTFDLRTIAPLLTRWSEDGRAHAGVILVPARRLAPGDIGGVLNAVRQLSTDLGPESWRNRVVFLTRQDR